MDGADGFPAMFDYLDTHGSDIGVASYGISVTTLEEVFLRVGHAADDNHNQQLHEEKKAAAAAEKQHSSSKSLPVPVTIDVSSKEPSLANTASGATFWQQIRALTIKRWKHTMRDRKGLMWQIGYPVLILLFGILVIKIAASSQDQPALTLDSHQFTAPMPFPMGYTSSMIDPSTATSFLTSLSSQETITPVIRLESNITTFAEYMLSTARAPGNSRYGAMFINGAYVGGDGVMSGEHYTLFINTTARHAYPTMFNWLTNARLQHARISLALSSPSTPRVTIVNNPLPISGNLKVNIPTFSIVK
jgi:ATP-binding cassette subfamily A (ABC1) protein 3